MSSEKSVSKREGHLIKKETPLNQLNRRVRAILLTADNRLLFIKRVKPNNIMPPYWVAPGGGVEDEDDDILSALHRELDEELGATVEVMEEGFILRHHKGNKNLEEYFYICRLLDYDLSKRNGPEFDDPSRGQYIPDIVELSEQALNTINIKTIELRQWLLNNLQSLRNL